MSSVEKAVKAKILLRASKGKAKYGVTMEREDLSTSEWLTHAQEEATDLAIYIEKLLEITQSEEFINLDPEKWQRFLEWDEEDRCHSCGSYKDVHECWNCDVMRCTACDLDEMRTDIDGHTYCHDCTLPPEVILEE